MPTSVLISFISHRAPSSGCLLTSKFHDLNPVESSGSVCFYSGSTAPFPTLKVLVLLDDVLPPVSPHSTNTYFMVNWSKVGIFKPKVLTIELVE